MKIITEDQVRKFIIDTQARFWYGILFALLAVASGLFLLFEILIPDLSQEVVSRIQTADVVIAFIFLADFFIGITCALNRRFYFKENWINLVSSVPIPNTLFRTLRLLRFMRAFRVIRAASNVFSVKSRAILRKSDRTKDGTN